MIPTAPGGTITRRVAVDTSVTLLARTVPNVTTASAAKPEPDRSTTAPPAVDATTKLTVLSALPGCGWVRVLFLVPKPLRNAAYSLVARNRYRIFGKYDECFVPDAEMRARVME